MSSIGPSVSARNVADTAATQPIKPARTRYSLAPMMPGGNGQWAHWGHKQSPAAAARNPQQRGRRNTAWGEPQADAPDAVVSRQSARSLVTGVVLANPANTKRTKRKAPTPSDQADMLQHDQATFIHVLDPYSPWRVRWTLFVLLLIGYVLIVAPFEIAFVREKNPGEITGLWICNLIVDLSFLCDMVLTFNTAYFDAVKNVWIMDRRAIALEYGRCWFFIDLVSIFPFELALHNPRARWFRILRVFKLSKLLRAVRSYKLLAHMAKHVDVSTKWQTLIKYAMFLLFTIHWCACLLRIVTYYSPRNRKTVLRVSRAWGKGLWAEYVQACLWSFSAMNGEYDVYTDMEFVLNLAIMLMGCFILAFLLGELTNTVSNLDPVTNNFRRTLDNLNDYMARSNFPEKLRLKLREYIMLSENIFRDNYYKEILDQLSPNLLAVVAVQNFGEVVCRIPFVAYTVQAASGIRVGSVVTVHAPDWVPGTRRKKSQPALTRTARITCIPKYLCYNVKYLDNGEEEVDVDNSRIARVERPGPPGADDQTTSIMDKHHLLHYEYAQFTVTLAKLLTSQLYMATDTIVHRYLSMNDALYVIESGNVKLFGRKSPRLYDVEIRQTNEFFGDDISMVVAAESEFKPVLRHYTARAGRITQLLVMDAEKLHTVLQSPSFALFSHHIKKYGRWMRLKVAMIMSIREGKLDNIELPDDKGDGPGGADGAQLIGDGGDSGDGVDSGDMLGTPRLGNYAEAGAPWPAAGAPAPSLGEATASVVNKLVAEVLSKSDADRAEFAAKRPETAALVAQLARSLERDASAATWSGGESYQASPAQNLRTVEFDHGGSAAGSPPTPPVLSNGVGDNFDPNSPAALHGFSLPEPAGDADEDKAYSFCGAFGDQPGGGGGGGGTA